MADTIIKNYVDFETLSYYDQKAKARMQAADEKVLSDSKEYADSLAVNYDAAGTAQTKVDELANGQVKTNTEAITALDEYVGTLPETTTATNVIDYIDEKCGNLETTYTPITNGQIDALFGELFDDSDNEDGDDASNGGVDDEEDTEGFAEATNLISNGDFSKNTNGKTSYNITYNSSTGKYTTTYDSNGTTSTPSILTFDDWTLVGAYKDTASVSNHANGKKLCINATGKGGTVQLKQTKFIPLPNKKQLKENWNLVLDWTFSNTSIRSCDLRTIYAYLNYCDSDGKTVSVGTTPAYLRTGYTIGDGTRYGTEYDTDGTYTKTEAITFAEQENLPETVTQLKLEVYVSISDSAKSTTTNSNYTVIKEVSAKIASA